MPDLSHLYSCSIDRPKAGFFDTSKTDVDGCKIGSFAAVSQTQQRHERSELAHRLVKAAKSPTQPKPDENQLVTVAGLVSTVGALQRQNERVALAMRGDREGWEQVACVEYREIDWDLLWRWDCREAELRKREQTSMPVVDPSRIGDGAEQTHQMDLTTGEITRVRCYESDSRAVVEYRDWCDEYRIRTKVDQAITDTPPEQAGPRYTSMLSLEGARKISESCRYMAEKKDGFTTFLTLTLDSAARRRVEICRNVGPCTELEFKPATKQKRARYVPKVTHLTGQHFIYCRKYGRVPLRRVVNGPSHDMTFQTVQKELARFWDAANKLYKRGWVEKVKGQEHKGEKLPDTTHRGEPHEDNLHYAWVVENPKNEQGQDNPHIHIMMRWRVPYRDFKAWAQRLEKIWGQGFAHLEKIKEPEKAGSYMAKAAGYMTKGEDGGQGLVRGNRYGISRDARAPDWEIVGVYENGLMGTLVRDVYDHFICEYGDKLQRRNWLKDKLEETPKEAKNERQKIGKALEKIRKELNAVPHRPSKYQLVIKGKNAARQFFNWAKSKTEQRGQNWLPPKEAGAYWQESAPPQTAYGREFRERLRQQRRAVWSRKIDRIKGQCVAYWKSVFDGGVPDWADPGGDAFDYGAPA